MISTHSHASSNSVPFQSQTTCRTRLQATLAASRGPPLRPALTVRRRSRRRRGRSRCRWAGRGSSCDRSAGSDAQDRPQLARPPDRLADQFPSRVGTDPHRCSRAVPLETSRAPHISSRDAPPPFARRPAGPLHGLFDHPASCPREAELQPHASLPITETTWNTSHRPGPAVWSAAAAPSLYLRAAPGPTEHRPQPATRNGPARRPPSGPGPRPGYGTGSWRTVATAS